MIPSSWVLRGKIRGLSTLGYSLGYHTGMAISHNCEWHQPSTQPLSWSHLIISTGLLSVLQLNWGCSWATMAPELVLLFITVIACLWNEAITALVLWTADMCQYKETQVSLHFPPWTMTSRRQPPLGSHGYCAPFLTHPLSVKVPGATSKVCMLTKERVIFWRPFT